MGENSVAILDCMCDGVGRIKYFTVRRRCHVSHTVLPLGNTYSPNGDGFLISASEDNKTYVYNLSDYRLQHLSKRKAPVMAVAVNPQTSVLATGDTDGTICLWRQNDGKGIQMQSSMRTLRASVMA